MRKLNPSAVVLLAALLVLIGIGAWAAFGNPNKTDDGLSAKSATNVVGERNKRCASQRTYGAIQQELFRQAAETRGSDEAAFGQISNYSIVRMEQPLVRSFDKELGTVRCSGKLILQLPRGIAVVGGRQALAAEIDYVLQPAADGSGDVVMLEGEDPITVPLATLARSGSHAELVGRPASPAAVEVASASVPTSSEPIVRRPLPMPTTAAETRLRRPAPTISRPASSVSKPQPATAVDARLPRSSQPASDVAKPSSARVKPSFNCRYAHTRGEVSVCRDAGLATLDRRMAGDYYRAVASANASQREALRVSRNAFLRKRDRCSTEACMSASYQERMSEIGTIMSPRE